jgi:hypothetical protein
MDSKKLTIALFSMNPLKRNSSRSPDGSSNQRKFSRGGSRDTGYQRKSSANTNLVNANADPRLLRGSRSNVVVQSPISTDGSAYQDAASNRTTPQPQQPPATAVMAAVGDVNDEGEAFKKQLLESLMALTSHITTDASLRSSYDLAKFRLERATIEHKNMEGSFSKFPAIKERTSNDKAKAAEKVAKLEKQLDTSGNSQVKLAAPLCDAIWGLFSKVQASSLPEPRPDAVSREDYDGLEDRFQKQQDLLDKQSSLIEELTTDVKEAKETAVQAKNQASKTDRIVPGDIAALNTRIGKVETSEQTDKPILRDLVKMVSNQKGDIQLLRSDVVQNKSDLAAVKEDSLTRHKGATLSASEGLGKLERQLIAIKNDVGQIWKEILEPGKSTVIERLKTHDKNINNLWTRAGSSESSSKALELRVKSAEELLENLSQNLDKVKGDNSESERIKHVEERIVGLGQELDKVKADALLKASDDAAASAPANSAQSNTLNKFDPDAFKQEVVDDVEEQTATVAEAVDEHGKEIDKLKAGLGSLTEKLDRLELDHDNEDRERQSQDLANNERHNVMNAKCDRIQAAVIVFKNTTDTLRKDIDTLSTTVEFLQDRPSQTSSAMNATVAQQFRPVSVQPPRAPTPRTSVSGPTQTNGIHPPNGTVPPQQTINGTLTGPSNGEVAINMEWAAVWAAINSLKQRYDNLTTEELMRKIVDQSTKIYPAAKAFQEAVLVLQDTDKRHDAKLTSLEMRLTPLEAKVGGLAQNMALVRHEFKSHATEVNINMNGRIQQLQVDVTANRDATNQLRDDVNNTINAATKTFDDAVGLQTDKITEFKKELVALADIAFGKKIA